MKAFCEKVEERVGSDEYLALLRYLHDYGDGGMTGVELQMMVSDLLGKFPGFLDEFLRLFYASDGFTRSTKSAESSNKRKTPADSGRVGEIDGYDNKKKMSLWGSKRVQSPNPEPEPTPGNKTKDLCSLMIRFCEKVRKEGNEEYLALLKCLNDYGSGKITMAATEKVVAAKFPKFGDDFREVLESYGNLTQSSSESDQKLIGNKGKKPNNNMKSNRIMLTPSYHFLPEYLSGNQSSEVDDDLKVLNTCCYSKGSYGGGRVRPRDPYDEMLNEREDELFERDMLVGWVRSTKEHATKLWAAIAKQEIKKPDSKVVNSYFTACNFRLIERMHGDYGPQMVDALRKAPEIILPLLLTRLGQKQDDLRLI